MMETENEWMLLAALVLSLNLSAAAFAQETCESKAVSREGKPLAGAAKTSFLKKCKRDTCQVKAVGSNGRALAGAAKKSFMQKCERKLKHDPESGTVFGKDHAQQSGMTTKKSHPL